MVKPKRVPTCGHPDRPHRARGLCRPCHAATPDAKAKRKAYYASEGKAKQTAYLALPEVKARRKARSADYAAARYATPEGKAKVRAAVDRWRATPAGRARQFLICASAEGHPCDATVEEVIAVQAQTVCKICGVVPEARALDTDHCHVTRKLRGMLCRRCNLRAAHLDAIKHDKALADRWAAYL